MSIQRADQNTVEKAGELLRAGKLVAFPTETVYGLGANALLDEAVQEIYRVKERPNNNPLIVHVPSVNEISQVADLSVLNKTQENWLTALSPLWPGPLTVVLPKNKNISEEVTAGKSTVGVRIPRHKIAQRILRAAGVPVAAPSANRSNYVSPTRAQHVYDCMGEEIELIVDGGLCIVGIESTIISLANDTPTLLRRGAYSREEIEKQLGTEVQDNIQRSSGSKALLSPGQMITHYSPRTPLRLKDSIELHKLPSRYGAVLLSAREQPSELLHGATHVSYLSNAGDLTVASQNLYEALRELDKEELDMIVIDSCDDSPLGRALMDRISRATSN